MDREQSEPKTFIEAVPYFQNLDNCLNYLAKRRWPNGVACPTCGSKDVGFVASRRIWQCRECRALGNKAQFSIKTGTVLEDSPLGLDKWLPVIWLIATCKNGVSSWEIHRDLGVTQKTAWFMLHRVRLGMQDQQHGGGKLASEIEADESFIGGKARNMHPSKREQMRECDNFGKTIVSAVLERGGKVRAKVIPNRKKKAIQEHVREHVEAGSNIYTDDLKSYDGLDEFTHQVVNHAECYVNGQIHTNGLENFWSLLKRSLKGTYVSVEPYHLFRYVDEQAFRYNNRKDLDDAGRFSLVCSQIVGKRLTYEQLTGKVGQKQEDADAF